MTHVVFLFAAFCLIYIDCLSPQSLNLTLTVTMQYNVVLAKASPGQRYTCWLER